MARIAITSQRNAPAAQESSAVGVDSGLGRPQFLSSRVCRDDNGVQRRHRELHCSRRQNPALSSPRTRFNEMRRAWAGRNLRTFSALNDDDEDRPVRRYHTTYTVSYDAYYVTRLGRATQTGRLRGGLTSRVARLRYIDMRVRVS